MPARKLAPLAAALALTATFTLSACGGDDGGAEQVGNNIDQKISDGQDKVDEGKDKVGDAGENAGDKAEDLGDKAEQKTDQ